MTGQQQVSYRDILRVWREAETVPQTSMRGCSLKVTALLEVGRLISALTLEQILDMVAAIAKIPGDTSYREPIPQAALDSLDRKSDHRG
jgi:hypothetical protein